MRTDVQSSACFLSNFISVYEALSKDSVKLFARKSKAWYIQETSEVYLEPCQKPLMGVYEQNQYE